MPRRERPPLAGKGKDIFFFFFLICSSNTGADLGGGCRGFSNTTGILQKKTMWFIGDEVEQETSAPPPKKILDPPLDLLNK